MIYIISEYIESSTDEIYAYCLKDKNYVKRINHEDMPLDNLSISISDSEEVTTLNFKNNKYSVNKNDVVWYRRGAIKFCYPFSDKVFSIPFLKYIKEEEAYYEEAFYTIPFSINDYQSDTVNNKLNNLIFAKRLGLKIPNTLLTSSKQKALFFLENNVRSITKPLNNGHFNDRIIGNLKVTSRGTIEVFEQDFLGLADTFAPIFLQQYIPKEFEIRVFYFLEKFYSMAIFSQNDEKTSIDYRNYNSQKPNRVTPYLLPKSIEDILIKLIEKTKFRTCSFDFIYTPNGEYYFLEINPNGQFAWVSENCNYYIEKEIAKKLNEIQDGQNEK